MGEIRKNIKDLERDLASYQQQAPNDRYIEVMTGFIEGARETFSLLEEMHKKMDSLYKKLSKYFAFDEKKYKVDECFGDLKTFKDNFIACLNDNIRQKEMEEKARRAAEAKAKAEKEKRERMCNKIDTNAMNQYEEGGLMEHLINSLHTGSAFNQYKRKRTKAQTPQGKHVGIFHNRRLNTNSLCHP